MTRGRIEQVGTWIAGSVLLVVVLMSMPAAADDPTNLQPRFGDPEGCGGGERTVATWVREPRTDSVDSDGAKWAFCLMEIYWGDTDTPKRDQFCLQAYLQRWTDWPWCPMAQTIGGPVKIEPKPRNATGKK